MRRRVVLALALLAVSGCGPKPIFRTGDEDRGARTPSRPAGPNASRPSAGRVEEVASTWLGTPYRYGGTDERGVDCSAFVQNVMGDLGARVPRTTRALQAVGREIPLRGVHPGDLLFFRLESTRVNHVGLALGPDRFIHASSSRGVVVDRLMDDYFGRRLVEARRVLPDP